MSEASKNARRANIAKAKRLTSGSGPGKVDASSWTPPATMNADKKTGMRPIKPRTYKHGGKVQGDRGPKRADKAPRQTADEISTVDTKQANKDKFGAPHIGGMKKGGVAEKCGGGAMKTGGRAKRADGGKTTASDLEVARTEKLPPKASDLARWRKEVAADKPKKQSGGSVAGGERPEGGRIPRASGGRGQASDKYSGGLSTKGLDWRQSKNKKGYAWHDGNEQVSGLHADKDASNKAAATLNYGSKRAERASGGRTKGKTNINIIVNPNKPDAAPPPSGPMRPPMAPPPPPPMPPAAPPPGAPPPNMPPPSMMAGAGGPPMRARGGRLGMNKIGGGGGGLGRLEKANLR